MTTTPKRLLIMAAGTGGHIFPGLAIANVMMARGWQISWIGTSTGMECDIVPSHGITLDTLNFSGLRGKGLVKNIVGALKLVKSFFTCYQIIKRHKPDVVLGMGGYVTVPGGIIARLQNIPLALVNADAALLLSNKILAPFAQRILFGFADKDFPQAQKKFIVTGNPIRQEITTLPTPKERYQERTGPLHILIIGGSLGARVLNEELPKAFAQIPSALRPTITHQSGKQHIAALKACYAAHNIQANVVDFIDDMAHQYSIADLVICRAGAITLSELATVGVASILIPLVASTTSHQRTNAQLLEAQHAAMHLPQHEIKTEKLAQLLQSISRAQCLMMAEKIYAIRQYNANTNIANIVEELANVARKT